MKIIVSNDYKLNEIFFFLFCQVVNLSSIKFRVRVRARKEKKAEQSAFNHAKH